MKRIKATCQTCKRSVGVVAPGKLARHKKRKGSKDHARCAGSGAVVG